MQTQDLIENITATLRRELQQRDVAQETQIRERDETIAKLSDEKLKLFNTYQVQKANINALESEF